ncbi:MAG: hypothetical protein J5I65_05200 [Aridibacter famidurans]|nr:hypothetical protein [Aridibacter famidurans]
MTSGPDRHDHFDMQDNEFRTGVIRPIECYREGWEAIKPHYWLIFVITIVGILIGAFSLYILLGPMVCGIFYCYFRALDGEDVSIEHLFRGFRYLWPSLFVTALIIVPVVVLVATIYVPLLLATLSGTVMTEDELWAMLTGTIVIEFIVAIVMVCLHTLIMFSFPLIVDRELSAWKSVTVSARAVLKNLKGVTGLWAASFVVTIVGYLALCVGLYFVVPVMLAANVAAYRKVFPKPPSRRNGPPGPEEYL